MIHSPEIIVIGAGIVDVLVTQVDEKVFLRHSTPARDISMQTGGDALNEALILSRIGRSVRLVSCIGQDMAGEMILDACRRDGVDVSCVARKENLDTGVNIVLVAENGERSFITNPNGGLRKITPEDVFSAIEQPDFSQAKIASFASIFVYPLLMPVMEEIFKRIREKGLVLCADMTRPKNGERIENLQRALQYVDYIFPNYSEAAEVTGKSDLDEIANAFLDSGVKNVVIKQGDRGCFVKNREFRKIIPAVPSIPAIDTTGAGDNFVAGFIAALYEGKSIEDCAKFANATASVCVERIGASSGKRDRAEIIRRAEMISPPH